MEPQKNTAPVRKVRTFAEDMRRAQGITDTPKKVSETKPAPADAQSATQKTPQKKVRANVAKKELQQAVTDAVAAAKKTPEAEKIVSKEDAAQTQKTKPITSQKTDPFTKPESHLEHKDDVFDIQKQAGGNAEGTIVTDVKHNRWSLTKEVGKSLADWAHDKKETVVEPKQPARPNVAPASTRADVIKEAGAKSHIAPQDDHKKVVARLRTFATDAERATGKPYKMDTSAEQLSQKEGVSTTTDNTQASKETALGAAVQQDVAQEVARDSRSIKEARASVQQEKRAQPQTVPQYRRANVMPKAATDTVAPEALQTIPDQEFLKERDGVARREVAQLHAQPDVAPTVTTRTPVPPEQEKGGDEARARETLAGIAERRADETEAPSRDIAFTLPTFGKTASANLRTLRDDAIEDVEERKLSVPRIAAAEEKRKDRDGREETARSFSYTPIIVVVVVLAFSGAAAGGYFWFTRDDSTPQTTTIEVPSFVGAIKQTAIPFTGNRSALITAMNDAKNATSGTSGDIVQLYLSVQTEFGDSPVATAIFMSVFDPQAPGSFLRSLGDDMMFGVYFSANRDPFFVFKTSRFDTAFAGMLAWEETMSTDLAPIFGEPVRRTLDPTARSLDGAQSVFFVDETIRNRDVRILYDETGAERLLYSFIDTETILITTSPEAFIDLIERL